MNKLSVIILTLILSTVFVVADWKTLDENARGEALQVQLLSSNDVEIKVKITIPGYHEKLVKFGDQECTVIHMPGSSAYMLKGCPVVPKITKLVKIEHDCKFKVEVVELEEVEVDLKAPIVPSKGHFTREIDPESMPFEFGPVYQEDAYWPSAEAQFSIGENFQWRDACGVRLQVLPLRANHVQMKMKVLKSAVLVIKTEQAVYSGFRAVASQPNETYSRMYSDMFLNYEEPTYRTRSNELNGDNRKLVVVTPEKYSATIQSWVD
jgi:gingipain R